MNPTTIEMKKEGSRYKVNLYHYDMKEWWYFDTLLEACHKKAQLLKQCPTAEVIEIGG